MGSESVVVDISSDEEDNMEAWVFELFGDAGRAPAELDDIVIVDDLSAPAVKLKKGALIGDPDDECLVLDFDPDKSVTTINDKGVGGDADDDLLIVKEKGQVACRDYPHPRHLCANYPFSSSPHVKHCNLCHCYVCDSPAPCNYWGNGNLTTDHCHSTDKDAKWNKLRQSFRLRNMASTHPEKQNTSSNIRTVQNPQQIHQPNPVSISSASPRPSPLRPCSATNTTNLHPVNGSRYQRPSIFTYGSQRLAHPPAKLRPPYSVIQSANRAGRFSAGLSSQLTYSRSKFKRNGTTAAVFSVSNPNLPRSMLSGNDPMRSTGSEKFYSTTLTSQRPQCPQEGIDPQVTSVGASMDHQGSTASGRSQCMPLTMQTYKHQPVTSVSEISKSWQAILASVASDLGVSNDNNGNTSTEQPLSVSFLPLPSTNVIPQTNGNQANGTPEHGHVEEPQLSTMHLPEAMPPGSNSVPADNSLESFLESMPPGSNSVPGDNSLESFLASVEKEMLAESENEVQVPGLDPNMLLYDLGVPWSSLAQV